MRRSTETDQPLIVFAHGAGAGLSHPWMVGWVRRLGELGRVVPFEYDYMRAGRRAPDRLPRLLARHRQVLADARTGHAGPVFLAGKSMGSRVGCHLAVEEPVDGVICFGYPLRTAKGAVRDEVLLRMTAPALFLQGSRDPMGPLDLFGEVLGRREASSTLHVVEGGDHSLKLRKGDLKRLEIDQEAAYDRLMAPLTAFMRDLTG